MTGVQTCALPISDPADTLTDPRPDTIGGVPDLRAFKTAARNWEAFGESDPFFGVLSDPTKYGSRWDPDEFFASGRAHVEKLFRTLSDACIPLQTGTCLDFGCGPGRLTLPLSASFERTVGVDVARPMIEAARGFKPAAASCEFVVNRHPDLRQFRAGTFDVDRKSTRLNSSHLRLSRMPSSA